MDFEGIQKELLRKLVKRGKWEACHTEERNLFRGLPKHLIGTRECQNALHDLYQRGLVLRSTKTNEIHVSLNIEKRD